MKLLNIKIAMVLGFILMTTQPAIGKGGFLQNVGMKAAAKNPLLRGTVLPLYSKISHRHVNAALKHLINITDEKIASIEQDDSTDFASLFDALGEIDFYYRKIWLPIDHLHYVRNEDRLRPLYEAGEKQVTALYLALAQNPVIYRKLLALEKDTSLDAVQQRLVKLRLNQAKQQGIGLEGKARKRFNAISEELATLEARFANNNLDATKDFKLILREKGDVAGLPASFLARAAQNYEDVTNASAEARPWLIKALANIMRLHKRNKASAEAGPWLVTLDLPSYVPFMEYSERRDLREQVYRAYIGIAAHAPFDNTPLIKRILQLRQEQAQLLGYQNHAERVLSDKMAGNVANVERLLDELHAVGHPNMLKEREQLNAYAKQGGNPDEKLAPWDIYYWERKLKEEQLDIDPEALRQYFPLPRVLDGLFGLLNKMFGISIEESADSVQVWHDDVKFYHVLDVDGTRIGSFYLDLYSRPQNKRAGAWKSNCNVRYVKADVLQEAPVCNVVANFSPPTGDAPALLSMREVTTLFHEFGHAMHELLTTVDYSEVAGTKVERDAVEMPSNLMEYFIYVDSIIPTISAHVDTGQPLPAETLARLRQEQNFRVASQLQRQLYLSYLDLHLHSKFNPDTQDPLVLMRKIYEQTLAEPPLDADRFINRFNHIFAMGYDVNYYGYKWGEVLAADAFELFKELGFDDDGLNTAGTNLRKAVLSAGGSKSAQEIFIELRGRLPSARALLKSYELIDDE